MKNFKKLLREELKSLNGGKFFGSTCVIKVVTADGQSIAHPQYFSGTNQEASAAANNECLRSLQNGATKCGYDCAYDGYGN